MRIIGGNFKGRTLCAFKGDTVRPTSDNARESLFNILGDVSGAEFLDLFSGTGAVGIEALSRGANVTFNDADADSVKLTRLNLEKLGIKAPVFRSDAAAFIRSCDKKFDFIFCDPPYQSAVAEEILYSVSKLMTDDAVLIFEDEKPQTGVFSGLVLKDVRRYGRAVFSFFGKQKAGYAVYAGTFDPITKGHESSIKQAIGAFGRVFVTVGKNPDKTPFFSEEERFLMLSAAMKESGATVIRFSDFKDECAYSEYLLKQGVRYYVRGIRNEEDFSYEKKAKRKNGNAYPSIDTVYIFCEDEFKDVSSTKVKNLIKKGKDAAAFIPDGAKEVFNDVMRKKAGKI